MTKAQDIKKQIRDLRAEMKAAGVPARSCFNGGHTPESYRYNATLFRLKTELGRCDAAA